MTLLPKLLRTHYDHILIFHGNKDIGRIIPYLRYSEIWAHQNIPKVFDSQIIKFPKPTHPISRRAAMIKRLGADIDGTQMEIFLNKKDLAEASIFLKTNRMKAKDFLYFNIGASLPHKRWPSDKVVDLIKLFIEK